MYMHARMENVSWQMVHRPTVQGRSSRHGSTVVPWRYFCKLFLPTEVCSQLLIHCQVCLKKNYAVPFKQATAALFNFCFEMFKQYR